VSASIKAAKASVAAPLQNDRRPGFVSQNDAHSQLVLSFLSHRAANVTAELGRMHGLRRRREARFLPALKHILPDGAPGVSASSRAAFPLSTPPVRAADNEGLTGVWATQDFAVDSESYDRVMATTRAAEAAERTTREITELTRLFAEHVSEQAAQIDALYGMATTAAGHIELGNVSLLSAKHRLEGATLQTLVFLLIATLCLLFLDRYPV
jgi:hypothetical protein